VRLMRGFTGTSQAPNPDAEEDSGDAGTRDTFKRKLVGQRSAVSTAVPSGKSRDEGPRRVRSYQPPSHTCTAPQNAVRALGNPRMGRQSRYGSAIGGFWRPASERVRGAKLRRSGN
jgi:hypothetical protein